MRAFLNAAEGCNVQRKRFEFSSSTIGKNRHSQTRIRNNGQDQPTIKKSTNNSTRAPNNGTLTSGVTMADVEHRGTNDNAARSTRKQDRAVERRPGRARCSAT